MTDEFKCLIWVKKKAKMVCNWRKNVTELKEIKLRTEELIGSIVIFGMNRIDESSLLANPSSRTFVKVYKSGSFGRSLDIAKFSSYNELRSELAHMFGLEGQLEDPLRSGWQIVFVDRENDVLLLGDDPLPEFVNSVWCIKILSPQEVQQMGKQGIELLTSVPVQRLSSTSCDNANKIQEI